MGERHKSWALCVVLAGALLTGAPAFGQASPQATTNLANATAAVAKVPVPLRTLRPTKFVIGAQNLTGRFHAPPFLVQHLDNVDTLNAEAEALALLGLNAVDAQQWFSANLSEIDASLRAHGLWRQHGNGVPISIGGPFGTPPLGTLIAPPLLKKFATTICPTNQDLKSFTYRASDADMACYAAYWAAHLFASNGGTGSDLRLFKGSDENAVAICQFIQSDCSNMADPVSMQCIEAFRLYSQTHQANLPTNAKPQCPLTPAPDSDARKLRYWTARFFLDSALSVMKRTREAVNTAHESDRILTFFKPTLKFASGDWYAPGDQTMHPSPLQIGRAHAGTVWFDGDWADLDAQTTSFYADVARSASTISQLGFGAFSKPECMSDTVECKTRATPDGASYKILSIVGHGAKALTLYHWDSWSVHEKDWFVFEPIAKALRRLAWGERVLYPGRPARSSVAVMANGMSRLWDKCRDGAPHYAQEVQALHTALVHDGYSVDFVDDADLIVDDALRARGYAVLFVTQPNAAKAAQAKIDEWVRSFGGTLVVTPGAAVADEFDEPTTDMESLLGLTGRERVRPPLRSAVPDRCQSTLFGTPAYVPASICCETAGDVDIPSTASLTISMGAPTEFDWGATPVDLYGPIVPLRISAGSNAAVPVAELTGLQPPPTINKGLMVCPIGQAACSDGSACTPGTPTCGPSGERCPEEAAACQGGPTVIPCTGSSCPGITMRTFPNSACVPGSGQLCGHAIAYGFFPGWQYWLSPDRKGPGLRFPRHWSLPRRQLVTAATAVAGAPRLVEVQVAGGTGPRPEVEVDRLDSDEGIALVLLNWTYDPVTALTVTVKHASPWTAASSLAQFEKTANAKITSTVNVDNVQFTVPLDAVDVVLLERPAASPACGIGPELWAAMVVLLWLRHLRTHEAHGRLR